MERSVLALANPVILKWARENIGYGIEAAAKKIGISNPEKLRMAEEGTEHLTINQLRNAAKVYRRPFPLFFLESPPKDAVHPDFRVLFTKESKKISPEAKKKIMEISQKRNFLNEITDFDEKDFPYEFIKISADEDFNNVASQIRKELNIDFKTQIKWKNKYEAFNAWRNAIEKRFGILIFQLDRIEIDDLRGFSIDKKPFPIIAVNSKDLVYAKCFTLLHELCHILLETSNLCKGNDFNETLAHEQEEIFCNYVSGAILAPKEFLIKDKLVKKYTENTRDYGILTVLSNKYRVSKEAILRRLLILNYITNKDYKIYRDIMSSIKYEEPERGSSGFNYYTAFISRNSYTYLKTVFSELEKGNISLVDVSLNLKIKINNLDVLVNRFHKRFK